MDAIFSKLWVQIPGSMAAGPGSSKKWHGILQKKQLGLETRLALEDFFLWNSGNFFGCFNIFNAFALKTLVL